MRTFTTLLPLAITLPVLLTLQGCATSPVQNKTHKPAAQHSKNHAYRNKSRGEKYTYEQTLEIALLDQYQLWKGTPYRHGGLNHNGIDCSGFVYRTIRDGLGRKLPRTTTRQSHQGYRINKSDLRTGDLVFFKTPGDKQHVGIYMDNGLFMHASTSVGVTISRLDNQYWRDSYWQSRRIAI